LRVTKGHPDQSSQDQHDAEVCFQHALDVARQQLQRWVADSREASRRYGGDVFVARTNQPTLTMYLDFFGTNRRGKRVGLVEVVL
jgi:hypothetical protein